MALIRETGQVQGDRVSPQSVELEMCVLGAVMLEPRDAYYIAADFLQRDSFYLDGHGIIFELMGDLIGRGIPPDSVAVLDELRSRQLLDKIGGSGVVMAMLNSVPTAANVEYHARKVREKAILRLGIRGATEFIEECYRQDKPLDVVLDRLYQVSQSLGVQMGTDDEIPISSILQRWWEELDDRELKIREAKTQGLELPQFGGVQTGFYDLNKVIGGLKDGHLYIIAARPSVGKTALACSMLHEVSVLNKIPSRFYSLEMGAGEIAGRMLSLGSANLRDGHLHGVAMQRFDNPDLSDEEWSIVTKAYERLMVAPITVGDSSFLTIQILRARVRTARSRGWKGVIVVDYLQLMEGGGEENRTQEVSSISRGLKNIARDFRVPVVALSQLKRPPVGAVVPRPKLSDLRESGAIEQDADVVVFIHRDDERDRADNAAGRMPVREIIVAKNRNGPLAEFNLRWYSDLARFLNA